MPETSRLSFVRLFAALPLATALLTTAPAEAAEVKIFRSDDRAAALLGEADGVAVGAEGEIRLAPQFERLGGLDEPFLFTAARHPGGGVVVGTGNDGKIVRLDASGTAEVLGSTSQPGVYAVHVTGDGRVLAAGSPEGVVVQVAQDSLVEIFDPQATYVWDLAEEDSGRLLVATGLPGKLWRLGEHAGDAAELLYESPDSHVRTVLPRPDGSILIGTAGQGLVVRLAADGSARTLYDAGEPEVLAFAVATRDGGQILYAALLASEASQVDLSAGQPAEAEATVAPSGQEATLGSRGGGYDGPRSRVVAIRDDGRVTTVAELADETIHGLAVTAGELWLATGQEGRLYRLEGEHLVLESSFDERQIVAVLADGDSGLDVATTDSVAVHHWGGQRQPRGTLTSRVLDAGLASRFGVMRWWGEQPAGSRVGFEVRAGMASTPDATWSDWLKVPAAKGDGADRAVGDLLGAGRYVQWRASLERGDSPGGPRLEAVELSYRQQNRAPRITSFEALAAGEILVPQSFNPTTTTFEPWSPNREGIFTSIRQEKNDGQQKTLWKHGYRTLRWKAEDDNGDDLVYSLEVRRSSAHLETAAEGDWLPMARDLDQTWYSFDSTVLPDGHYRFRLTGDDRKANPHGAELPSRRQSEPVIIDHTSPRLVSLERTGGHLEVVVEDAHHPIRDAVFSVDVGEWRSAESADGLLDGRRERLRLEVPREARLILLRLTDAAFNVVTLDLSTD